MEMDRNWHERSGEAHLKPLNSSTPSLSMAGASWIAPQLQPLLEFDQKSSDSKRRWAWEELEILKYPVNMMNKAI